jgi:hypothetical protein
MIEMVKKHPEITVTLFFGDFFKILLYEFKKNLALHLERSPLIHSYCYGSKGDSPTCLAKCFLKFKSFMKYVG